MGPQGTRNTDGRGAHGYVLCLLIWTTKESEEAVDHVWGAIDFTPTRESTFPDWRKLCTINATNTTIMNVPREGDNIRLYIDLGLEDGLIDKTTGRVSDSTFDSNRLQEVSPVLPRGLPSSPNIAQITRIALKPFTLEPVFVDWWTLYISTLPPTSHLADLILTLS